uniref:Protein kinase domain-containing protein n=1 Tax=Hyaloperonospora arabidopsidis (strain Emoy2) TaxID=559515 RepID=M4BUC3_HYAAE
MACIQHPNVLQVDHLIARTSNYVALVTEFAPNGDLFDLLETSGALPEPLGKVYTCQLLRALAACHANGVVHRDVKPENLLLDATYQLKLADFGVRATAPSGMQVHDLILRDESGTVLYMAPEVKSSQGFYRGPPVDVWSAGIVLFILLTGLPPFNRAERGDVSYDALLARDFASFWKSQPDQVLWTISAGARHLITSMLQAPKERITVTEALQHSWLRGADQVDSDLIHQAVLTHLEAARTA